MGLGITDYDQRRRGVINWEAPGKSVLQVHYQRLAHIRAQIPAFSGQGMVRLTTANGLVYAYSRPYSTEDGIVVVNVGSTAQTATITLPSSALGRTLSDGVPYVLSDLMRDSSWTVNASGGTLSWSMDLPPYGSAVFALASTVRTLSLPSLTSVEDRDPRSDVPTAIGLDQNYPNPFNPSTSLLIRIPELMDVSLKVYSILGTEVATLASGPMSAGAHRVTWNGQDASGRLASSGTYVVRLQAGSTVLARKMLLIR